MRCLITITREQSKHVPHQNVLQVLFKIFFFKNAFSHLKKKIIQQTQNKHVPRKNVDEIHLRS